MEIVKLFNKSPVVIVDLIKKYLDTSTRYCEDCNGITPKINWMIDDYRDVNKKDVWDFNTCPNCNSLCYICSLPQPKRFCNKINDDNKDIKDNIICNMCSNKVLKVYHIWTRD